MTEKVRWGILGAGRIAAKFTTDIAFAPSACLQAVGSGDRDRSRRFAEQYAIKTSHDSYDDLLADPDVDAIYIATPHNFHLEQTLMCLQAGKHVLCEKPMTVSAQECETLIEAGEKSGLYVMEAMWTWFLPTMARACQWMEDGRIGELVQIRADFGFPAPFDPQGRLFNPDLAGGALLDIGIYPVAFNRLMLGRGPDEIKSSIRLAPTGVDAETNAIFTTGDTTSLLTSSLLTQLPNTGWVFGTQGTIEIPNFWQSSQARLHRDRVCVETFDDDCKGGGFEFEIEAASQDILQGRQGSKTMPLSTSLAFQKDMEKIRQSAGIVS